VGSHIRQVWQPTIQAPARQAVASDVASSPAHQCTAIAKQSHITTTDKLLLQEPGQGHAKFARLDMLAALDDNLTGAELEDAAKLATELAAKL